MPETPANHQRYWRSKFSRGSRPGRHRAKQFFDNSMFTFPKHLADTLRPHGGRELNPVRREEVSMGNPVVHFEVMGAKTSPYSRTSTQQRSIGDAIGHAELRLG